MKYPSDRHFNLPLLFALGAVMALASACGAANSYQPSLNTAGPAGVTKAPRPLTLTPYAMAYGRAGATAKARDARPAINIDDYLLAEARNPRAPAMPARRAEPAPVAPVAALPPEPVVATTEVQSVDPSFETEQAQLASAEPPKAPASFDRYSERARSERDLLDFRGGDAIVITASTLVIVLLIVLLVVLLD